MLRYLLFFLPLGLFGAECTKIDVLNKELTRPHNSLVVAVKIQFTGDVVNRTEDYRVSGANALNSLRDIVTGDCETMEGFVTIPIGQITKIVPTPVEQAILNAQIARAKLQNLNAYVIESGKTGVSTMGTSGITITQAKNALIGDVEADVTNAARLTKFLEEVR